MEIEEGKIDDYEEERGDGGRKIIMGCHTRADAKSQVFEVVLRRSFFFLLVAVILDTKGNGHFK